MLEIRPTTYRAACEYIQQYHRHSKAPQGCKFCISCYNDGELVGVAIAGRPVSRELDDGLTCEITRVCTDGTHNACSKLYGACCNIAKAMGYKRVITYTLESESGSSLKASNFTCEGAAGCVAWRGKRNSGKEVPKEMKRRWTRAL